MTQDEDFLGKKESFSEHYFGFSTKKFSYAVVLVLIIGVYGGLIFFGDNSLSVLLELEEHQSNISDDIERLKAENAMLQKQYFELKELDADYQ